MAEGVRFEITVDDNGTPKVKRFTDAMKGAEKGAKDMGGGLGFASGAMAKLGGLIAVGAVVNFAKDTMNALDAAKQFGQQVGISTASVVGFGYAADMSGSSAEDMQTAMVKLAKNLSEGTAEDALKSMGIASLDAAGNLRGVDSVMLDLAGSFEKMKDGPQKTAIAMELFGKSGAKLIPALNQGTESMRAMSEEGAKLQGATDENADAMDRYNDSLEKLQKIGMGAFTGLMSVAQPVLEWMSKEVDQLTKDYVNMYDVIGEKEDKSLQDSRDRLGAWESEKKKKQDEIASIDINSAGFIAKSRRTYLIQDIKSQEEFYNIDREKLKKHNEETLAEQKKQADKEAQLVATRKGDRPEKEKSVKEKKSKEIDASTLETRNAREERYLKLQQDIEAEEATMHTNALQYAAENTAERDKRRSEEEQARVEKGQALTIATNAEYDAEQALHEQRLKDIDDEKNARLEAMQATTQALGNLGQIVSNINQIEINGINSKYDEEVKRADGNATKITAIEKRREAETQKVRKDSFALEKGLALAETGMKGAQAFVTALTLPPPFGEILAGTIAALTATQMGVIASQKFAVGGAPTGSHALVTMNEQGQEYITNAQATRTLGQDFLQSANSGATVDELASRLGRGGRGNVTLNVTGFIDSQSTADYLVKKIQKEMRRSR